MYVILSEVHGIMCAPLDVFYEKNSLFKNMLKVHNNHKWLSFFQNEFTAS